MSALNRTDAQQRADEIAVFNRELARLEAAQVLQLSEAQQQQIKSYQQRLLATFQTAFDIDPRICVSCTGFVG